MKNKLHLLFVFIITFVGYAQTGIGAYSAHDGGFENHVTTLAGGSLAAANLSTTLWTANTTANNVSGTTRAAYGSSRPGRPSAVAAPRSGVDRAPSWRRSQRRQPRSCSQSWRAGSPT